MKDYLIKTTAAQGDVRAYFATTRNTVNKAVNIHRTSPVVSAAFGRLLTGSVIMGAMLKNKGDLITVSIKCSGPLKGMLVTSDYSCNVKGYVNVPAIEIPLKESGKLDVSGIIGDGTLSVVKDIGLKEPYAGQVPLVTGEIAEDLAQYFVLSEQTPSAVSLGILVERDCSIKQAGGFILQMLPNAKEETIVQIENSIKELPSMTNLFEEGKTPEEIMEMLFKGLNPVVNEKVEINYSCNCTKDRAEKALIAVGREEINSILEEQGKANLHCPFCDESYDFSKEELIKLLETI